MRLLLLEDVAKLGHVGDIVEVTNGYARNYLLPGHLATEPTEANIAAIEDKKKAAAAERARRLKEFTDLAAQMQDVSVTIEAAANPEGTLYGGVHEKDIADALHAQGYAVNPDHIVLEEAIRTLDNRIVTVKFTDEISTEVKVWVVREGGALEGDDVGPESESESDDDADDAVDDFAESTDER